MSEYLPLLSFILKKSRRENGELDIDFALNRINNMIGEFEADRKRTDRATMLMADELGATNMRLRNALTFSKVQNIRFQAALDNMKQGLALYDKLGRIVVCNRRFVEIYDVDLGIDFTGFDIEQILNHSRSLRALGEIESRLLIEEQVGMSRLGSFTLEQIWSPKRNVRITRTSVDDGGFLDTIEDIYQSQKNKAQIAQNSKYDALTNLPNKNFFESKLQQAIMD